MAGSGSIGVLHQLAERLGGRVKKRLVRLVGGTILTHQLRTPYRKHKIDLRANDELVLIDVEAAYGSFHLFMINRRPRTIYGKPAHMIRASGVDHIVFTLDGSLSEAQSELCESGPMSQLLDVVNPREGEEINVSQRLFRVYLQEPTLNRVMAVIDAVIELMPHVNRAEREAVKLPDALKPLRPLLARWAIDDDGERSQKLQRCQPASLRKLVDTVVPLLPAIDKFLDSFGTSPPEAACALGSLAQAALEARYLLSRSARKGQPRNAR